MKLNLSLKTSLGVEMSLVTDEQVVAQLDSLGVPSEYFFLFPVEGSGIGGLIGSWHPEIGFRYLILENDELAKASYAYLMRRGARQFLTTEELNQAISSEKWLGWDTCADAIRERQVIDSTPVL
jgi:hypothetical protein